MTSSRRTESASPIRIPDDAGTKTSACPRREVRKDLPEELVIDRGAGCLCASLRELEERRLASRAVNSGLFSASHNIVAVQERIAVFEA